MKRFFQISSILLMTIFFFSCSNLMRGETGTIVMELPSEITARVINLVDDGYEVDIEAIRLEVSIFDKDSIEIETQKKDIDELNFDESKNNSLIDANFSFELDPGSYKAVVDFIYPDSEDVLFSGESDYFEIIAGEITPVTVSIKQYYDHFVSFTNSFDLDSEEDVETPVESIFRFVKDGYKLTIPEYMFELEENSNFEYWFDLMELNEKLSNFLSNVGNITIDDFNEDSASNDLDLKNIYSEITKYMPGDEVVVTKDIIFAPLISPSIVVPPVTMYSVSFTNGESIITKMIEEGTELQEEDFPEIESERKEEFLGWFDENGEKVISGYKVTSDVSITARYEEKHLVTMYSVSFTNGESIITKTMEEGTELKEEDFPEIESERMEDFLGWFDENGEEVLPGYKVTSDVSIAARYEEKHLVTMLSVMFTNGAAVVRKTMEEGTELQEEDFPKIESERKEEFLGWFDENGEKVISGYKVTSDVSITARYEEKHLVTMYSVSFTNGESIITKTMEEGTELKEEDFPKIERKEEFLGWFDENGEEVLPGYKVTSDVSIAAKYEEKHLVTMLSVSFTNGESIITKMIEEGTELQEKDFPEIESERIEEFLGWYDENGEEVLPGYKVTSDVSIAAKYEEKLEDIVFYDVTADMPLEIKQNIDNQNYANVQSGTKIKLIAPEGAEIKYLKTEDGGSSNWYTYEDPIVIEKDCRISASYKIGDLTSNQIDVKFSIFKKASANVVINYAYKGDLVMEVEKDDYSDVTLTVKSLSGKALKSCGWLINGVVAENETKLVTEDVDPENPDDPVGSRQVKVDLIRIGTDSENSIYLDKDKISSDDDIREKYGIILGSNPYITCIAETEDGNIEDISYLLY